MAESDSADSSICDVILKVLQKNAAEHTGMKGLRSQAALLHTEPVIAALRSCDTEVINAQAVGLLSALSHLCSIMEPEVRDGFLAEFIQDVRNSSDQFRQAIEEA